MSGSSQDYLAAHMYLKDPISISTNVKGVMSMLKGPYALWEKKMNKKLPMPKSLKRRTPICFNPALQA
jgi:hypothetical protein